MEGRDILDKVYDAVVSCDEDSVAKLVNEAVSQEIDLLEILDRLNAAIKFVGDKFGEGDLFITDLIGSAQAMKSGTQIIEPLILKTARPTKTLGQIAMATAEGDIHDIGKNIVIVMLRAAGFRIIDLGVDVSIERIMGTIRNEHPQVVGVSALLTSTVPAQERLVKRTRAEGLRGNIKLIVGGAAVTAEWAEEIGADGYAADGIAAVAMVKKLLTAQ